MKDDTDSSLQPTPGERRPSIGRRHALTGCRTPARTAAEAGELWTIDEVADCLGVPKQTVYSWRTSSMGRLVFRVGKHVRWRAGIAWTLDLKRQR